MLAERLQPQADPVARREDHLHGEEGVDGSSPSEGSAKAPTSALFRSGRLAQRRSCGGMEPFMELSRSRGRTKADFQPWPAALSSRRPKLWLTGTLLMSESTRHHASSGTTGQRLEMVVRDDAKSDGTFEMGVDCICGGAKVSASVHCQHWREQPEDAVRGYRELVIDARRRNGS